MNNQFKCSTTDSILSLSTTTRPQHNTSTGDFLHKKEAREEVNLQEILIKLQVLQLAIDPNDF